MATGTQALCIEELYKRHDDPEVQRFLREHPEVVPALLETYPFIERFFGPNPRVELELFKAYDSADPDELFANIVTHLPTEEALDRLTDLELAFFPTQPRPVNELLWFSIIPR